MILEQIDQDLKQAMRDKNEIVLSSLRNLKSEIKNVQIAKQKDLSENDVVSVVNKKVKQHKDSIEQFKAGGREDLASHEQDQMAVLQKYLPEQMTEDELKAVIQTVKSEMNASAADFGKVMKETMNRTKGQADGSQVSKLVKELLA